VKPNYRSVLAAAWLIAGTATAADDGRAPAAAAGLTMQDAAQQAVQHQPLLDELDARARAERESAIAARQLPDPSLIAGVSNLPVDTADAYSLRRDSDTQLQIGLNQELTRGRKRALRGDVGDARAAGYAIERRATERSVRRDAALAWLALWRNLRIVELAQANLIQAQTQAAAVQIALESNRATQAELLAARIEAGRMHDAVAAAEQSVDHARFLLSRWIGDLAFGPISEVLPAAVEPPSMEQTVSRIQSHPLLTERRNQLDTAQRQAELARASYAPDWRVQVGYAHRPDFSEMAMLQFGVDLPVFTHQRQDRTLAAAQAQAEAAEHAIDDSRRQLEAEARLNHHDWLRLQQRLRDYDDTLLPQAQQRIDAALAAWSAGQSALTTLLEARRAALELQMTRLDLQYDFSQHAIQLQYLGAYDSAGDGVENPNE